MNTLISPQTDQLTRFLFDDQPIRGAHVHLTDVWQHIEHNKRYPKAIRHALGELTAAAVLLAANLKFKGQLLAQVQGNGTLKMLVAEATSARTCRATARWDEHAEIAEDADLKTLLGEGGRFVLTLQPADGEPWQGIVALEGDNIAQMLMNYLAHSEQLDSQLMLAANGEHAAGLLLQKLPESEDAQENQVTENEWENVTTLAQTLTPTELLQLDAHTVLYRLYHETPPRVFAPETVEFACTCSRGKVSDMLLLLGAQEVGEAVAEQGSIEINCDFCHERYVYDENDVNSLFGADIVSEAEHDEESTPLLTQ